MKLTLLAMALLAIAMGGILDFKVKEYPFPCVCGLLSAVAGILIYQALIAYSYKTP